MAGPFNLGALVPFLDDSSPIRTVLGSISVFTIWGLIVTAIGLGVLYRRKSRNIAITLILRLRPDRRRTRADVLQRCQRWLTE